jgi:hypothetical protein
MDFYYCSKENTEHHTKIVQIAEILQQEEHIHLRKVAFSYIILNLVQGDSLTPDYCRHIFQPLAPLFPKFVEYLVPLAQLSENTVRKRHTPGLRLEKFATCIFDQNLPRLLRVLSREQRSRMIDDYFDQIDFIGLPEDDEIVNMQRRINAYIHLLPYMQENNLNSSYPKRDCTMGAVFNEAMRNHPEMYEEKKYDKLKVLTNSP